MDQGFCAGEAVHGTGNPNAAVGALVLFYGFSGRRQMCLTVAVQLNSLLIPWHCAVLRQGHLMPIRNSPVISLVARDTAAKRR